MDLNPQSTGHNPQLTASLFTGFILTGIVTTLLGPILPWLATRWSLSDASAGFLFTLQFCGGFAGGMASGSIAARLGESRALASGFVCMSAGVLAIGLGAREVGATGVLTTGLGFGVVIPLTNLMVARLQPRRPAAALGALNLAWGAGALVWPVGVAAAGLMTGTRVLAVILSALLAAMALRLAAPGEQGSGVVSSSESIGRESYRPLVLFGVIFPLYVGTEAALGGWLTEYARRLGGAAPVWGFTTAAFWTGLTLGRALLALAVPASREAGAAASGLFLATGSVAGLLLAGDERFAIVCAAGAGLGLSPMFPVTVAALAREDPGRAGGPLIALGSVGGAGFPWLVGIVSAWTGSLRAGLSLLLATCGAMLILHFFRIQNSESRI